MAVSWPSISLSPLSLLQTQKHSSIPKPLISETRIHPRPTASSFSFSLSISTAPNLCFPSLPTIRCSTTSDSASASNDSPSTTTIFIKGLPRSTTEGRLMKAFSEFGEVNQVKILTDTNSGQSLGSAFVSFAREEFAQSAIKQMNGKFFDGRFIFVTIAKPRSTRNQRTMRHYKF